MIAASANAQTMFNVRVGPTFASRYSNEASQKSKGLVAMGGGGGFRIQKGAFSFDPAIMIVIKGTESADPVTNGKQRLKLQYIELPLVGTATLFTSGRLKPFIEAGPVIDLEMRCRVQFISSDKQQQDDVGCDLQSLSTPDRHKFDFSVAGGGGLDYNLEQNRHVLLEVRYTHGLSNISDSDDRSLVIRNRALSVYIGYSFPINPDI
jgi:hypothetical protein